MTEQLKIECQNCIYWKNNHCENFSSKWLGMVTARSQNCGYFKAKKVEKKKDESSNNKKKREKERGKQKE